MPRKVFVDTGAWIGLLVKDDEKHREALNVWEKLKRDKVTVFTSDYVIDEAITLVLKKAGYRQSRIVAEALFESKIVEIIYINPEFLSGSWNLYKKFKCGESSFTDVTSLFIMQKMNFKEVFTFADHFSEFGFQQLK